MQLLRCRSYSCMALLLSACLIGCGDGRPERVAVTGQVMIDGEPLRHSFVQVIPDNARPAVSPIDSEGRFTLSTFGNQDGCIPGTHKVAVNGIETISPTRQKWHAPKRYMDTETSVLTLTIDENTKEVKIELSWDGEEPVEETFAEE